jgi:hypothetical protein
LTSTGTAAIYAENDWADKGYGVYASVTNGTAIYGSALGNGGVGVQGYSSTGGLGVVGVSTNGFGVDGEDTGTGVGIYGASKSGYAGYFDGNVYISGELQVVSTVYTSDRNLKSDIQPIDGKEVLARVSQLPISSWHYTSAPDKRHVGPMAQDFHAAFGLNGADDTHISEVDIGGVSLAAIQELNSQMKSQMQTKDAQIAALQAQVAEQMKVKDAQIAELNVQVAKLEGQTAELKAKAAGFEAQAVAQTQAMAQVQQTLSARMTALEHRGVASTQAVALEQSAKQRVAID